MVVAVATSGRDGRVVGKFRFMFPYLGRRKPKLKCPSASAGEFAAMAFVDALGVRENRMVTS